MATNVGVWISFDLIKPVLTNISLFEKQIFLQQQLLPEVYLQQI